MPNPAPDTAAAPDPIPYRMALAGGWIDQPFISRLNPTPPGSMVVISLEPSIPFMELAGMATGTRKVAQELWPAGLPNADPMTLVRELYAAENQGRIEPSGSQDMIGLLYPGISRLDYDARRGNGGIFPAHIESTRDPAIARWLESVIHLLPIAPRPDGYNPLVEKHLDPAWIQRLGQSGQDCYSAILRQDIQALAAVMNFCMVCWEKLLPSTIRHPALTVDLPAILKHHQEKYAGAMYSGCGGGYLYIVSDQPVPGTFQVRIRTA